MFGGFDGLGDQVQGPGLVLVMFAQDAPGQGEARLFQSTQGAVQVIACVVQIFLGLIGGQPGLVRQHLQQFGFIEFGSLLGVACAAFQQDLGVAQADGDQAA
ncbi:hypothetical protein D3C85_1550570 [compost metagenome]